MFPDKNKTASFFFFLQLSQRSRENRVVGPVFALLFLKLLLLLIINVIN